MRTVRGTALAVAAKSVWANSAQQGRRGQFRPVFIVLIINTDDVPGEVIGTTIGELQCNLPHFPASVTEVLPHLGIPHIELGR